MKKLSWRWKVLVVVALLLLPGIEHLRKKALIIGRWQSLSNFSRLEYEPGGKGTVKLFYESEMIEEYKIKGAFFIEEQWTFEKSNGKLMPYAAPGSGLDPENGRSVHFIHISITGQKLTTCSKIGCSTYERY